MKLIDNRQRIRLINLTRNKSMLWIVTLGFVAFGFSQFPATAQTSEEANQTIGEPVLLGLARGDILRFNAFNPAKTESGELNESINVRLKLHDARGQVIAESAPVEIPPGEFRSIDVNNDDLPPTGASRDQFRTTALWGFRSLRLIRVTTSLEIIDNGTGQTRVSFHRWVNLGTAIDSPPQ